MEYDDQNPPEAKPIQPSGDPYSTPQHVPPHGPPPYGAPPPGYVPRNDMDGVVMGLGVAGLVVGIISLLISMITCFGGYAIYPAGLAILLSGIATVLAINNKSSYSVLTIVALVISLAAMGKGYIEWNRARKFVKDVTNEGEKILKKGVEQFENEVKRELQRRGNK